MLEWVEAYNLPIFTIVTKIDYIPRGKHLKVLSEVKKNLKGEERLQKKEKNVSL